MTASKRKAGKESANRVGIDIGTSSLKILQVSGSADKPSVVGLGCAQTAGLSGSEMSDALKSLADESKISAKDAYISISGPSVIVRFLSLPRMDENALKGAIKYEAEKFIPYNISDCSIDFQTLRREEKDNKLSVLLVAAKKDHIVERMKVVEKAGFNVKVIDVDSFALSNAFLRNQPPATPEKSSAILNIGSTYTNLSILKGESIFFARDITLGGNDFTISISKKLGLDQKAAEAMKIHPPKDKLDVISDCLKSVFSDLVDEVKLSFGYYENQAGKGIDDIYLSGGGALMAGLEQMFEEGLGSRPIIWNPLGFLAASSADIKPRIPSGMENSFAIAAGLVTR